MKIKRDLKFEDINMLAIVVGEGELPTTFISHVREKNVPFLLVTFEGVVVSPELNSESFFRCKFEEISDLFDQLALEKINYIVFCGKMVRPNINLDIINPKSLKILQPILNCFNNGDDDLFRSIISAFNNFGIQTLNIADFMIELLVSEGLLTDKTPSKMDMLDANRAEVILKSISSADIGQSLVVAQGLCVAVETLPGTDAMLKFVALHLMNCRPDKGKNSGILFKGKKRGQTALIDLPTVGPETVREAHIAGLSGIVIQENAVIVLKKKKMISLANDFGIFIWSRKNKLDGNIL